MRPMFSIITVCYNAADTLPRTLRSVAEQTCRLFEHLVIDGASTDSTVALAKAAGIPELKVWSQPDKGIYDAMNQGLAKATGDYVIFLNAGDTFHSPHTLQLLADTAMRHDYPGVIYGQTDIVDAQGRFLAPRHLRAPEKLTIDSFAEGMVVCHQAFVVLRRLTGSYDLRYRYSADYDWCIKCLQHSKRNVGIDKVIIDYLSEGATTRHRHASLWERFRIMAHHYGLLPTIGRHLRFIPRFLRRRKLEKSISQPR